MARDHSKSAVAAGAPVLLACAVAMGCGGATTVPRPAAVQVVAEDYVPVPHTPRPPPVEIVPPRPGAAGDVVWADGGWEWSNERYRWDPGGWVIAPPGAKRARWVVVRREVDGQLFFAPSTWRNASGKAIDTPKPLTRARTRVGGPASGDGPEPESAPE